MSIKNYKTFINESNKFKITEQIDFLNRYIKGKWHLNDEGVVDVDGDFNCFNKGISDFIGIKFGKVNGDFDCSHNNLSSLEGAPKEVTGNFDCSYNNLTSLKGSPKEVGFGFYCQNNSLTSLKGSPKEVGFGFYCQNNNLISLEGAPIEIGREFYLDYNEGASAETLKSIYSKMKEAKSDYKTVLKSSWKEISIEDKILLYTPDLDWVEEDEAAKLSNLKKYNSIKKMI